MQKFDAIRPYSDEETSAVIQRLVHDREFLNLIGRIKSPGVARWAPAMLRGIVSYWLRRRFGGFTRIGLCWRTGRKYHHPGYPERVTESGAGIYSPVYL